MYNEQTILKLHNYFTQQLGLKPSANGWLSGDCPHCGKKKKFGVSLMDNRSNCFSCGKKLWPISVVRVTEGFETNIEAWRFLKAFEQSEGIPGRRFSANLVKKERTLKEVNLPEHYNLLMLGESQLGISARNYIKSRGFSIKRLTLKGVGYCDDGEYMGYIIFPFYKEGKLTYFQTRSFIDLGPKFKNPPLEAFGIGKTELIYNPDCLHLYKKVYLVESITNAETLGNRAFAIMGKAISDYQLSEIIRSNVEEVIILLDPDALKEATSIALKLMKYVKVKVVKLPHKYKGKANDVNWFGRENTLKAVKKTQFITYNALIKLRNECAIPQYT